MRSVHLGGAKIQSKMRTANLTGAVVAIGTVLPFSLKEARTRGMVGMNIKGLKQWVAPKATFKARVPANEQ